MKLKIEIEIESIDNFFSLKCVKYFLKVFLRCGYYDENPFILAHCDWSQANLQIFISTITALDVLRT